MGDEKFDLVKDGGYSPKVVAESQNKMFPLIVGYARDHGGAVPTYRWLKAEMGLSSTSIVKSRIEVLLLAGWLEKKDDQLVVAGTQVGFSGVVRQRLAVSDNTQVLYN